MLYSPDFEAALEKRAEAYGVPREDDPYRFAWNITPFVKPGTNRLKPDCL